MKLIFDVDAVRPPLTGVGRYAYELARGYAAQMPAADLRLYAAGRWVGDLDARLTGSLAGPGLRRRISALRIAGGAYRRLLPLAARLRLRGMDDHLFHGPAYMLPPFGGRSVATIHDLSTYVHPEFHPPERVRHVGRGIERALKQAAFLITDSEHGRRELVARFAWPETHVAAIPLGVRPEYHPARRDEATTRLAPLGLTDGGYVLYVGTIEPRKNLGVLLDAYEGLPPAQRARHPLVFAGYEGWCSEAIHARIARAEQAGWARYLGYVDEARLPVLTAAARAFVYPSRYEGFGLPVLEAMACGVPVVAADRSSIPEVTQGAAVLLDPDDVDGWRDALSALLDDETMRARMTQAGLQVAAGFSWGRTVERTLECLHAVAEGKRGRS